MAWCVWWGHFALKCSLTAINTSPRLLSTYYVSGTKLGALDVLSLILQAALQSGQSICHLAKGK